MIFYCRLFTHWPKILRKISAMFLFYSEKRIDVLSKMRLTFIEPGVNPSDLRPQGNFLSAMAIEIANALTLGSLLKSFRLNLVERIHAH